MMDVIADVSKIVEITVMGAVKHYLSETEFTDEEKMAIRKRFVEHAIPKVC